MTYGAGTALESDCASGWGPWPLHGETPPEPAVTRLLRCEASLTEALRDHSGDRFGLRVIDQTEGALAGYQTGPIADASGTVREVVLSGADVPWVFAQTIIPHGTAQAAPWLTGMGGRPLGDALFRRDDVVRSPIEFARLGPGQALYERATVLDLNPAGQRLWARRSCFFASDAPLLVTEVFLPALCPTP